MSTPKLLTPVALEYDQAYAAGRTLFDHLARDIPAREALKKALSESGGAGADTDIVDPIFSPQATAADLAFFKENPSRTHAIREAIDGEPVLASRSPASDFVVCVRQLQGGFRMLVAIPVALLDVGPTTQAARLDSDDVLSVVFEIATSEAPDNHIYVDRIIEYVDAVRSAAATTESDSQRRLS
jgi:hypothetical protein